MTARQTTELATFDLELRETAGMEQRIVTAMLVPYGETSMSTEHRGGERFIRGAFRKSVADRARAKRPLLLFRAHDHGKPVGKALSLKDTEAGPLGEFRIAETSAGNETLAELKEGLLPQVSIGFRTIRDRMAGGVREVVEAALAEVSLAPMGAYDGAEVLSLREPAGELDLAWVSLPPAPTVDPSQPIGLWR